jgi:hypothetical protein
MSLNRFYVSEEWLRSYIYERGKESLEEAAFRSQCSIRLAEARAMLRYQGGDSHGDRLDLEECRDDAVESVASPVALDVSDG